MNSDIDISKIRKLDGGLLLILQQLLELRSVTQTARSLNLSQSTISQSLGRLRELFGDPLFVRRPHGLEPTQRSLNLEPQIKLLIELASATLNAGQSFDPATSARHFHFAAPEFITVTAATSLLKHLVDVAPNVWITFRHLPESEVFEQLRRGEIDVAVGRFEHIHADVSSTVLYQDEFCIACRLGHPISRGRMTIKKYKAERHIWANSPSETIARDAEFDYSDFRGSVVPKWLSALVVAAQSEYIATCPRRLAESQAQLLGLALLALPKPKLEPFDVSIAHRKGLRDKGIEWFIEQISAVFKK